MKKELYIVSSIDYDNYEITLFDINHHELRASIVHESDNRTIVALGSLVAEVLGFLTNPLLIGECLYSFLLSGFENNIEERCEESLAYKNFRRYSVGDIIMLTEWESMEDDDRDNYENEGDFGYTQKDLEDMYRAAFEGEPDAQWNID